MSWAAVAGGVIGLLSSGDQGSQSVQREIDPRIAELLYGPQGLLGQVQNLQGQQSAQGGLNPMQNAGLEMQRQTLMDPNFTPGYGQMRSLGSGLMGQGVAGNPFTGAQPAYGQMPQMPGIPMGQPGMLMGQRPREGFISPPREQSLGFNPMNAAYTPIQQQNTPYVPRQVPQTSLDDIMKAVQGRQGPAPGQTMGQYLGGGS